MVAFMRALASHRARTNTGGCAALVAHFVRSLTEHLLGSASRGGIGGDENEWRRGGHPEIILDNLVADKKAMPMINVQMFEGRTLEQRRKLAKELTEGTCRALGCTPDAVQIILTDIKKENWAEAGKLFSD